MEQQNAIKSRKVGVVYSFSDNGGRRTTPAEASFTEGVEKEIIIVNTGESKFLQNSNKILAATVGSGIILTLYDKETNSSAIASTLIQAEMPDNRSSFLMDKILEPVHNVFNEMDKHGAKKENISIRLFGAAGLSYSNENIGGQNYMLIKNYLESQNLQTDGENIKGDKIRRIHFFADTGSISRFILKRNMDLKALQAKEKEYLNRIS